MAFQSLVLNVLIASPSDLHEERNAARDAIHEWNDLHAEAEGITLLPRMWETGVTPEMGVRPQASVNRQLVDSADLLVGMFWTKLGTGTGVAESGTVEEIDRTVAAGKTAMLYFSERDVAPGKIDLKQMKKLRSFKDETYSNALAGSFKTPDGLKLVLSRDLTRCVREMKGNGRFAIQSGSVPAVSSAEVQIDVAEKKWTEFRNRMRLGGFHGLSNIQGAGGRQGTSAGCLAAVVIPLDVPNAKLPLKEIKRRHLGDLVTLGCANEHVELHDNAIVVHDGTRIDGNLEGLSAVMEMKADGSFYALERLPAHEHVEGGAVYIFERDERQMYRAMNGYVRIIRKAGVTGPLYIRVLLTGISRAYLMPNGATQWRLNRLRTVSKYEIVTDRVILNGSIDGSNDTSLPEALRNEVETIWNSVGVENDPCFDKEGNYMTGLQGQ